MPDRIIRSGLFDSEAWLTLKNNDDRVCYIALLNIADVFGNQPAGPYRLLSRWRPYGVDTPEKVAKVLDELADVDLVMLYQADGKAYVHIQRFRQSTRFPGHLYPLHPGATPEEIQVHTKKSRVNHQSPPVTHGESPAGVGVGVGVKQTTKPRAQPKPKAVAPDWIPAEAWSRWRAHRGSKLTPQAIELQTRTLAKLRDAGHDLTSVIDHAIESGWAKFYEPKDAPKTKSKRYSL